MKTLALLLFFFFNYLTALGCKKIWLLWPLSLLHNSCFQVIPKVCHPWCGIVPYILLNCHIPQFCDILLSSSWHCENFGFLLFIRRCMWIIVVGPIAIRAHLTCLFRLYWHNLAMDLTSAATFLNCVSVLSYSSYH